MTHHDDHNRGQEDTPPAGADNGRGFPRPAAEPLLIQGFAVTYDRQFNLGNFEWLRPAITLAVKRTVPAGAAFDLHQAQERVRRMARENVRAQLLRQQGRPDVVFLGLPPPPAGAEESLALRTVRVSLVCRVHLGQEQALTVGYVDWSDVQQVAHNPGELHIALARLWHSLWANVADEIARARGQGGSGGFLGLPPRPAPDRPAANGSRPR